MDLSKFSTWAPDTVHIVVLPGILGVLSHLSILPLEIDSAIGKLIIGFLLAWVGLAITLVKTYDVEPAPAAADATLIFLSFSVGLFTSTAIYRLFFHRLRHFPGPWAAKLTRFYAVTLSQTSGFQYHLELDRLHWEYGDFVRTGPRELSINRASAVHILHGPQSPCLKSTWYSQLSNDTNKINLLALRNHDIHRVRRRAWDRGLGTRALSDYYPHIQKKVETFAKQLQAHQGKSIEIADWTLYYTFDVMGIIAFSKDFKQLDNGAEHFAIGAMHAQMQFLGLLGGVPWLMHLLACVPGLSASYETFVNYCAEQMEQRRSKWRQDSTKKPTDVVSWLLKAENDDRLAAPPSDEALWDEGRLAIVAGSDTTGVALANTLYFLATHPAKYARLQKELDEAPSTGNDASPHPYLDAVINEVLRLKPAVPSGQARVSPPEGLVIDDVWIPGDTNIIVPQHVLQRDERYFPRPLEFIPERWLDEGKDLMVDDRAFFPFSIGAYGCVGKQLAYMQMRMILRRIASDFNISLASDKNGEIFDAGTKDNFTMAVPPLQMVFQKRDASSVQWLAGAKPAVCSRS